MSSTARATVWSVTINNPLDSDQEQIALARQKGWKVDGQLEKGESGTPHYQLVVRTPQVRFSQVKKAFPRAHIEVARNPGALSNYVHKTDTAIGGLPVAQERYPSLSKFWDLIYDEIERLVQCEPEEYIAVYCPSQDRITGLFDGACSMLIRQGYYVESIAVNPQVRSSWQKFHHDILHRTSVDRQTDRQVESESIISVPSITNVDQEENASLSSEADAPSEGCS